MRGPYGIAEFLSVDGYKVSGQAVSKYLYGDSWPRPGFIKRFADAFDLTHEERDELAWVYTYGVHEGDLF